MGSHRLLLCYVLWHLQRSALKKRMARSRRETRHEARVPVKAHIITETLESRRRAPLSFTRAVLLLLANVGLDGINMCIDCVFL